MRSSFSCDLGFITHLNGFGMLKSVQAREYRQSLARKKAGQETYITNADI